MSGTTLQRAAGPRTPWQGVIALANAAPASMRCRGRPAHLPAPRFRPCAGGVRRASGASAAGGSQAADALRPMRSQSFVDFALSSQKDVAGILSCHPDTVGWRLKLLRLSEIALELWPKHAPHWRTSAAFVVPKKTGIGIASADASGQFVPVARAVCLRALCAFRHDTRRSAPLVAALVEGRGGEMSKKGALAEQLSLRELFRCVVAIGQSPFAPVSEPHLSAFVGVAAQRFANGRSQLQVRELRELRDALLRCGQQPEALQTELRQRLRAIGDGGAAAEKAVAEDLVSVVASASALGEAAMLRSDALRRALLPEALAPATAARLLRHALPRDGAPSAAHEFVASMAAARVVAGAAQLAAADVAAALVGVAALQAAGEDFAIRRAAQVLRALWPQVVENLPYFGPPDSCTALAAYCRQLQHSYHQLDVKGSLSDHPIAELSGRGANKELTKLMEVKMKLLRPVVSSMAQMPLPQVAACLTGLAPAPGVQNPLVEGEAEWIKEAVEAAFPPEEHHAIGKAARWVEFRDEFWAGEVGSLTTVELLELACGFKEVGIARHWVLDSALAELERRLRPMRGERPSVELSHFLLLRLCRAMDLWQGHAVEEVLTHLLSNPDALRPLPTENFVAVLSSLSAFLVPKEVSLRLAGALLDKAELGERAVRPEQWVDVLSTIWPLDDGHSWNRVTPRLVQQLVPHVGSLPPAALLTLLKGLAAPQAEAPAPGQAAQGAVAQLPSAVARAVKRTVQDGAWDFEEVVQSFDSLGRLGWYDEPAIAALLARCSSTSLLEPHTPLLLPLVRACANLRVHHTPLLSKLVQFYCWCDTYLRPQPLPSEHLDELLEFAEHLQELSFQSTAFRGVLAANLRNENATPRQVLALLSALARASHFPKEFKEACAKVCAESSNTDLAALSRDDLINAFHIHLCAVFDGPAALKHWLTEDEAMKSFFQVHTSQRWYQKQDQERAAFLQSDLYLQLKQAAKAENLNLRPSDPGDVYHIELVASDAKERLASASPDPPLAVVCIKSKEQLRWYVPITFAADSEEDIAEKNRCAHFRFMFRGVVQKTRHLQAMGYRTAAIWLSEWNELKTKEERQAYLRAAVGAPDPRSAAFSPSPPEEADTYA